LFAQQKRFGAAAAADAQILLSPTLEVHQTCIKRFNPSINAFARLKTPQFIL
jgi:hypothetical protein